MMLSENMQNQDFLGKTGTSGHPGYVGLTIFYTYRPTCHVLWYFLCLGRADLTLSRPNFWEDWTKLIFSCKKILSMSISSLHTIILIISYILYKIGKENVTEHYNLSKSLIFLLFEKINL